MSSTTSAAEEEIRHLDGEVCDAMLRFDVVALGNLMSQDFAVNNPLNQVFRRQQVLDAVASGQIRHTQLERQIEYLGIHGNTAVVMGAERVVDSGPEFHRRYTDVWIHEGGQWRLFARHANVVTRNET